MYVSEILDDVRQYTGQQNDDELFSILTKAINLLSNKGEGIWDPMVGLLDICSTTDGCLITLPRDVDTPLALSVNGSPRMFRNKWFEFHINGGGWRNGMGLGTSCGWYYDDRGDVPTYMDILTPSYLAAVADLRNDLKAVLRVYGYDAVNKWIRTQDVDGNWGDGFIVPLNLSSDFPMGLPIPSGTRLFIRNFSPSAATEFVSATAHGLTTGAAVVLSLVTPPLPTPLLNGITYYVRVIDSLTISLHATQSDAVIGVNPITLTSIDPLSVITLDDQRVVATQTKFYTATPHNMQTGQTLTFSGTTMPVPIVNGKTYYAFVIDANDFTVHANLTDALNGANPIDVSAPGSGDLTVNASQPLNPYTVLNFSVNHDFLQGDIVFASNTGGTLPSPLLPQTSYFVHYISATQITIHNSLADATSNVSPIVLTTIGTGTNALYKTLPASIAVANPAIVTSAGHNLSNGDLISFTTTGTLPAATPPLALNTNYQAAAPITDSTFELKTLGSGSVATASRQRTTNVASIVTGVAHGLVTGNYADISGMGDVSFNATFVQVTVVNATTFTYANAGVDVVLTADVGGSVKQSQTFNVTGTGTGQLFIVISRAFTIGFTSQIQTDTSSLTTGISVKLSTIGALPSASPALSTATTYYPRVINSNTIELYETQAKALDSTARTTATRQRSGANVATITTAANHGFASLDYVDVSGLGGTGYNATHVQITVTGATTFTYANTGALEAPTADVAGFVVFSKIQFFSLGSGTLSLILARLTSALLRSNLLTISSTAYLTDGTIVQFQTSGTLPAPLLALAPYKIMVVSGQIEVHDSTTNAIITLTNIGTGTHTLNIQSNFTILIPTTYDVPSNEYLNGDAVVIQAAPTQASGVIYVAPTPLVVGTTYYTRSIDNDTVELYDTAAHATNTASTTGRIIALSTATGQGQFAQTVADFLVQNQGLRVQKDVTKGFIDLYALDTARSNNLTQIGHFYPDETTPSYRRIRVESSCAWVRMRYKRRIIDISSSSDFIPLTSRLAVLYSCKAVQLLQDNYYDEGKKFEDLAEEKLKEEFNARMGPDAPSMQMNAWITTGVYSQSMM